ncbi:hypothetical protein [Arthrobacter sp. UM1]|uniref:hypothetical protein n=1 Tax=Arthrobacter sp. UM1 TaxID=2766776 RepID=UPI001CF712C0|nr:hypothetical protein [Arthrobacter sp. UM1]MCB4208966.1 hypothetical protein [Arthrobacter sp. UM1]
MLSCFEDRPLPAPGPPGPREGDWAALGAEHVPRGFRPGVDARAGEVPADGAPAQADHSAQALRFVEGCAWGAEFHTDAAGRPTSVRRRWVPSAGGRYPLQWHVDLPGEHLVANPETGGWRRFASAAWEELARRKAPGWTPPSVEEGTVRITLTALEQRTRATYGHRAPALVLADAAYAATFADAALGIRDLRLAGGAGEPGSADSARSSDETPSAPAGPWRAAGEEEVCSFTVHLAAGLAAGTSAETAAREGVFRLLASRRSPQPPELVAPARPAPARTAPACTAPARTLQESAVPHPGLGARFADQHWLDLCEEVELFHGAPTRQGVWDVHTRAARSLLEGLAAGRQARPVSGCTVSPEEAARGPVLLHALAWAPASRTALPAPGGAR